MGRPAPAREEQTFLHKHATTKDTGQEQIQGSPGREAVSLGRRASGARCQLVGTVSGGHFHSRSVSVDSQTVLPSGGDLIGETTRPLPANEGS